MELPTHSSLSYHGNSGEVGCYVASRPLTKDSNYFEVGRAGGEIIKLQGVFFIRFMIWAFYFSIRAVLLAGKRAQDGTVPDLRDRCPRVLSPCPFCSYAPHLSRL